MSTTSISAPALLGAPIEFSGPNIFDLKARDFPVEVDVAPIDDRRLVGFDFQDEAPYELALRGKGKSRALELRTRGGSKLKFRPEKRR